MLALVLKKEEKWHDEVPGHLQKIQTAKETKPGVV